MTTLYDVLGLTKEATHDEIRAAYCGLAKKYHPDVAVGFEAKMREIQQAHDVLTDPEMRVFYDSTGRVPGMNLEGADKAEVLNFTAQLMNHAIQFIGQRGGRTSLTKQMHELLAGQRDAVKQTIRQKQKESDALAKVKDRITAKEGAENVLGTLLASQINEIARGIEHAEGQLVMFDKVAKLIDQHDYKTDSRTEPQEPDTIPKYLGMGSIFGNTTV